MANRALAGFFPVRRMFLCFFLLLSSIVHVLVSLVRGILTNMLSTSIATFVEGGDTPARRRIVLVNIVYIVFVLWPLTIYWLGVRRENQSTRLLPFNLLGVTMTFVN